ncbi:cobaltochelatase subunit CobN [Aerosakkonema funiforme]|uniref:Cobaltochelatase subunit CobN n=3 Tax=Oscillatoriophycideae TaxID=1301283 RepID=A0A926ZGW9_9CYAN|nr:cobaltochelatase subunit CobN [Aerosakkonema funiforme]MBD2182420.1 cobaltochelatase subunit CobN [Aerosakkonema funiforme FACHB-1375]
MHRLAATPGGWNFQEEGVIFVEQTPAPIVFLTAADTDIQTFAAAVGFLPDGFPALRAVNLLQLQQQLSIDTYAEQVLAQAEVIIVRLLGGRSYWSYGLEVVRETVEKSQKTLIVMPGDDRPDPHLFDRSTVSLTVVNQLWRYFTEGGVQNFVNALKFVADVCLGQTYNPPPPAEVPRVGLYRWEMGNGKQAELPIAKVGILFYRAHYLAGNTTVIDALCQALFTRKLQPVPIFVSSLREPDVQAELLQYCQPKDAEKIDILLNTTSFSISDLGLTMPSPIPNPQSPMENLDVPVLQVIFSSGTVEQWESGYKGLSPRDMAMNVALPEVDGRIISRAISFKAVQSRHPQLETDVVGYEPQFDRIAFVADLALNWVRLRKTPVSERKIALILANYPNRDGRLANGVGLDTPASCVEILKALQSAGYYMENLPETSDELIARLTAGVTNDPEGRELRKIWQQLSQEEYNEYFASLPKDVQQGICDRWGTLVQGKNEASFSSTPLAISGIELGNVFVGIQPSRGYDIDPSLNYHAPDLEPTHAYLAFYYWVRQHFQADAIVHVGKHGNLEWLPGKSVALSSNCYPEVALGAMPHFYPFIVNDPGEGSQAKRRAQAVIIDHLTPPMTRAELYGPLQQLESSIDEYYEAQSLDPKRLPMIADRIAQLVAQENLQQDLEVSQNLKVKNQNKEFSSGNFDSSLLSLIDGYLCELKEAQIRDGLHIFGQCPQGRQLRDLIVAIARHPGTNRLGLTRAIAKDWGLDFDPLTADPSLPLVGQASRLSLIFSSLNQGGQDAHPTRYQDSTKYQDPTKYQTAGDAIELLEEYAANLVEQLIATHNKQQTIDRKKGVSILPFQDESSINFDEFQALSDRCEANPKSQIPNPKSDDSGKLTKRELDWISTYLLPALQQTQQEITQLLRGLDGRFVPSGPSGAPTRGRPEVLPTGRNFYSVDIRSLPTETAWNVGRKAAETLIEQYTQSNGEYPKTLGLSVWGTATMRTGGDDVAQALALLGVRPVWDGPSRRVVDFEILPVAVLGRPRVDVTLRISGFFRDAFPNLIDLFDRAVAAVAALNEPSEDNPLAAQVKQERQFWVAAGLSEEQAEMRSHYRIFGSKPGAYGAGLQGLIEAQNWKDEQDLARAYINWSSYAYTSSHRETEAQENPKSQIQNLKFGIAAPEAFEQRLRQMQIVLHNQDNREHDLLDSDDYYQFQGGLTAAVRALTGKNPQTYFGDNSLPENPKVRQLRSEIARVYRSRVVNPKWIAGVMRHGYKGAFEMSATVDYLFAYDATANCVEDFMYRGVAEAYLFEPSVQAFIQEKNPWALRDMAERLLEAHQRGLWQDVEPEMVDKLRSLVHQAEGVIESTSFMQF